MLMKQITKQPIKLQKQRKPRETKKISCSVNKLKARMDESPSKLNEKLLPANYAADKTIQKIIAIIKSYNRTAVSRLPSPWRQNFQSFSLDERGFLYRDNRLVIPHAMRAMIMCSLHYGHPGRDAMLGMISDIWWPKIDREVIDQARLCEQCLQAGKNLKCILKQKPVGKLPEVKEMNEEIALDVAGPFRNGKQGKKYMLVSIDHFSRWSDAKFLHSPTTKKVVEFLNCYISRYGVPKAIRTDPGTVFVSEEFENFCKQFGIKHKTCPVRDHRGNGKIERLIRTINERLRTNNQIVVTKDKSGSAEILYALRISKEKDGKSPFEKQLGREPNTVKSNVIGKFKDVSERDPNLEFEPSDFQEGLDSTVLVRERARGSKLESLFDKKTTKVIKESAHTITVLPQKSTKPKVYSKRDIASSSAEQRETINRAEEKKRKGVIYDSSSSEGGEEKRAQKKKKTKGQIPEMAIELEEVDTPQIIDIASSSVNSEEQPAPEKTIKTEKVQNPTTESIEGKSTTAGKTPKRVWNENGWRPRDLASM